MIEIEELMSNLLILISVSLAFVAIGYFGINSLLNISPEIKTFLMLGASTVFFGFKLYFEQEKLQISAYVVAIACFLTGVYHMVFFLELSKLIVFSTLVISSILFLVLGNLEGSMAKLVDKRYLVGFIAIAGLLLGSTVLYDLGSSDVNYLITYTNTTTIDEDGSQRIGYVVARNTFRFKKKFLTPELKACVYPAGRMEEINVRHEHSGLIDGNSLIQSSMYIETPSKSTQSKIPDTLKVIERDSCPRNGSVNTLIVTRS